MNIFTVPLLTGKAQKFTVVLNSIRYTIELRWNVPLDVWIMNVGDASGNSLANGIAVVAGADLLNQLYYLNFGGALLAQRGEDPNQPPTYSGLGSTDKIFYIPYGQSDQVPFVRE